MMHTLDIGDLVITRNESKEIWSVLGSCVAVIFFVKDKITMICHSQISSQTELGHKCFQKCPNPCFNELESSNNIKYVKCAVEYMLDTLRNEGVNFSEINTTLLGGASLMGKIDGRESVGDKNIKIAKEILSQEGIKIDRELTGGESGYTLWYNTKTDRLFIKVQKEKFEKFELVNNR